MADHRRVVYDFNESFKEFPDECLHTLLYWQATTAPEATALDMEGKYMTYESLFANSLRASAHLCEQLSVAIKSIVGLMAPRSFEFMIGMIASLCGGCAFLPIDPCLPVVRISWMLEDSQVSGLMARHAQQPSIDGLIMARHAQQPSIDASISIMYLDQIEEPSLQQPFVCSVEPTDLMYVLFTSGSTGRPKGVMIEHRSAVNFAFAMMPVVQMKINDRWFQWFSASFDPSVMDYMMPLLTGATLVLWHGHDRLQALESAQATVTGVTPSFMALHDPLRLVSLRMITPCGEPLPLRLGQQWTSHMQVLNGYGPTEATIYATTHTVRQSDKIMSIGKPLSNYLCYVLLHDMEPAPVDNQSELYIGGISVARGYIGRADLTNERFVNNPFFEGRLYKTGDLASWTDDGLLVCHGRIDSQVKLNGQRLEVSEIENVAATFPGVDKAAAVLIDKDESTAHLLLYVSPMLTNEQQLLTFLRDRLSKFMVPRDVFAMREMPTTPSGKLDRKLLASKAFITRAYHARIEHAACNDELNLVQEAVAITIHDQQRPTLFVTPGSLTAVQRADLKAHISLYVTSDMLPDSIIPLIELPTTSSGVVDRDSLTHCITVSTAFLTEEHTMSKGASCSEAHIRSETLPVVVELASQIVRMPTKPDTSMLAIGLDSIASIAFARGVSQRLSISVSEGELVKHATLGALAEHLDKVMNTQSGSEVEPRVQILQSNVIGARGLLVLLGPVNHAALILGLPHLWAATNYRSHVLLYAFLTLSSFVTSIQLIQISKSSPSWVKICFLFYAGQFQKVAPVYFASVLVHWICFGVAPPPVFWFAMQGWYFLPWNPQLYDDLNFGGEMWWWTSYVVFIAFAPLLHMWFRAARLDEARPSVLFSFAGLLLYASFASKVAICIAMYFPVVSTKEDMVKSYHIEYWPPFHFAYAILGTIAAHVHCREATQSNQSSKTWDWRTDIAFLGFAVIMFAPPQYIFLIQHPAVAELIELFFFRPMQLTLLWNLCKAMLRPSRSLLASMLHSDFLQGMGKRAMIVYAFHIPIIVTLVRLGYTSTNPDAIPTWTDLVYQVSLGAQHEQKHIAEYVAVVSIVIGTVSVLQYCYDMLIQSCLAHKLRDYTAL